MITEKFSIRFHTIYPKVIVTTKNVCTSRTKNIRVFLVRGAGRHFIRQKALKLDSGFPYERGYRGVRDRRSQHVPNREIKKSFSPSTRNGVKMIYIIRRIKIFLFFFFLFDSALKVLTVDAGASVLRGIRNITYNIFK